MPPTGSGHVRPFCFLTQFWGKQYRDYFVDYCLPSLLADQNLPLLDAADGHCFLIATPQEDWDAIVDLPVMQKLRRFATPVLIATPPPVETGYAAILQHQTFSLKKLFEAAYDRKAYGCAVWPDTILSNGFVAAMRRWAAAGYHLVMQPTVRLDEAAVLSDLRQLKLLPDEQLSATGEALAVPPRVVGELSARHIHPESQRMEEGHPEQPDHPPYRYWRMPGGRGVLLHVFFATPVLMDFAVVPANHTDCLNSGDWETFYVGRNFSGRNRLYVVGDSDESGILSITPADIDRLERNKRPRPGSRWMPTFALLSNIRASVGVYARLGPNLVRRDMFRTSVRWHGVDIDDVWLREEARIAGIVERAAGDYYAHATDLPPRISLDPHYFFFDLFNELQSYIGLLRHYAEAVRKVAGGDDKARGRLREKLVKLLSR